MKNLETILESLIFKSRWLLAPFFVGLILAIFVLLIEFMRELAHLIPILLGGSARELLVAVLTLVDLALVASLLLVIIFSGYENFVSKIGVDAHEDRPAWMGKVGFSDLKLKLMGSIVAISAIELLKAFVYVQQLTDKQLAWKVGIHLTFVTSGVLFAVTDRLTDRQSK